MQAGGRADGEEKKKKKKKQQQLHYKKTLSDLNE